MRPIEGIDKVGLLLNTPLLTPSAVGIRHIDPYNHFKKRIAGLYSVFTVNEEYFDPAYDYQIQLAYALRDLIVAGIIDFPVTDMTAYYIYKNPDRFILRPVALEFYSDFAPKNILIPEEMTECTLDAARDNGVLYCYFDPKEKKRTSTCYSPDGGKDYYRKSVFISYDKTEKDLKDNHIKHEQLPQQHRIRTEFRLYSTNCLWLHWSNLQGTYRQIFRRHKQYLSTVYNHYLSGCIMTKGSENKNFRAVEELAVSLPQLRYRHPGLSKTEPIFLNKWFSLTDTVDMKRQKRVQFLQDFQEFSRNMQNVQKAKEIDESMRRIAKYRRKY